jgi:hypothetical protein
VNRLRNLVLLVLVVICGASFWFARRSPDADAVRPTPAPRAAEGAPAAEASPPGPQATIQVSVLNGTSEAGLARRISRKLSAIGCVAVQVADAPHDTFAHSLLVNRRLDRARLADLAARLGEPILLVEWDPRSDEDAVIVLGADHARVVAALDRRR